MKASTTGVTVGCVSIADLRESEEGLTGTPARASVSLVRGSDRAENVRQALRLIETVQSMAIRSNGRWRLPTGTPWQPIA